MKYIFIIFLFVSLFFSFTAFSQMRMTKKSIISQYEAYKTYGVEISEFEKDDKIWVTVDFTNSELLGMLDANSFTETFYFDWFDERCNKIVRVKPYSEETKVLNSLNRSYTKISINTWIGIDHYFRYNEKVEILAKKDYFIVTRTSSKYDPSKFK